ncbi:hypothetical protein M2T35_28285, partial [Klebsiella pneumoniae]|uniref:hypothetical protein n=1 Tax=Klebsiella pneumoniae TaxID=573 RepID=UPI00200FA9F2
MYQFNTDAWETFKNVNLADAACWLNKIDITKVIQNYSLGVSVESIQAVDTAGFVALIPNIQESVTEIISVNSFLGGLNI